MSNLDPSLLKKLESMKTVPARDPRAAARGKTAFLKEAEILRQAVPARSFWRPINWSNLFHLKEQRRMGPIVALIMSLIIATGGSGAAVYAAQDAMPNDPLYAVKILAEDAQVTLTGDDTARANLMLDLALRRAKEIAATNGTNDQVIQREQAQITRALQIAAQLSDEQMNQILNRAREVLSQTMQTIPDTTATSARDSLSNQNGIVQAGLNDPNAFRSQFRHDKPRTSPYPIDLPPPLITATVPISGTPIARPPGDHRPPITATVPISGTPAAPPPPPNDHRPPITATVPMSGTMPPPPGDHRPPITATLPISRTPVAPPPPNDRQPPITGTVPMSGTLPPPPGSMPPPPTLPAGATPQPNSTPVAPPTQQPPATAQPNPTGQQQPPPQTPSQPPPPSGGLPPPPGGMPPPPNGAPKRP